MADERRKSSNGNTENTFIAVEVILSQVGPMTLNIFKETVCSDNWVFSVLNWLIFLLYIKKCRLQHILQLWKNI